jgi:hypothetical protein
MTRSSITITRKERRRDRRRLMQLEATLSGERILLTDLSAAGFGAALDATDRRPRDYRIGQRLRLDLRSQQGDTLSFPVEISRELSENGVIGGIFVVLTDAAYNTIESLLTGRFNRAR